MQGTIYFYCMTQTFYLIGKVIYMIFCVFQIVLLEKLKYAIYFCKSIDTDEYARVAMVDPTEPTASESDIESDVSEVM